MPLRKKTNKQTKNFQTQSKLFRGNLWQDYVKRIAAFEEQKLLSATQETNPIKQKKKEVIISLHNELKSKLSTFFFKPWIKNKKVQSTKKQQYLFDLYKQYQNRYAWKKRKDFLKTVFGQILRTTFLNSEIKRPLWYAGHVISRFQRFRRIKKLNKRMLIKHMPWIIVRKPAQEYAQLLTSLRRGWLYENLLRKEYGWKARDFVLDRPGTAFQTKWNQQKKAPWLDELLFQRWAYFGFIEKYKKETKHRRLKYKVYLRRWNPRFQKRNQLYRWRKKLLFDFHHRNTIQKGKAQRIKQVLSKIYLPFYGHLKQEQFNTILKKKKKTKSKVLNQNEEVLSSLESRLDVVVYRLNLAPSILWARRLIQEGSIFVNNIFSFSTWTSMYGQFKHLSFPLKLRDPKNLYKARFWDANQKMSKFKFFLLPMKKIHYLVKPGDFIQTAKSLSINKFKSNKRLWKKPITKHLYTVTKTKVKWKNSVKVPKVYTSAKRQAVKQQVTAAMYLFHPKFTDLQKSGRIQELFFRWMTL